MKQLNKRITKSLFVLCFVILLFFVTSCIYYDPPYGWTRNHHSYLDACTYAKSIDENAIVFEGSTDYTFAPDTRKYREWDAIINGINCHVASVSTWVFNSGVAGGEFARDYYRMETDYEYIQAKTIMEKYPNWTIKDTMYGKYNEYHDFWIDLIQEEYKELNDDELNFLWQEIISINNELATVLNTRRLVVGIPSPAIVYNQNHTIIDFRLQSKSYIIDFDDLGKASFIEEYKTAWDYLKHHNPLLINYQYLDYPLLSKISFDLDADGIAEELYLTSGITSGVFSFVITAVFNGKIKYQNYFISKYAEVDFDIKDDSLQLVMNIPNHDNQEVIYLTEYYDIFIENDYIVIKDLPLM